MAFKAIKQNNNPFKNVKVFKMGRRKGASSSSL